MKEVDPVYVTEWTPRRKRAFSLAFDLGRILKTNEAIAAASEPQRSRLLKRREPQLDDLAKSVERFFLSASDPEREHPKEWA